MLTSDELMDEAITNWKENWTGRYEKEWSSLKAAIKMFQGQVFFLYHYGFFFVEGYKDYVRERQLGI
jgi:hypothetical protein